LAQQINVSIEIDGQPVSPFSRLTISQRIDWHHHFEIVLPLDALEGTSRNALNQAKDFISKEVVISMQPKIFAREQKNIFKGLITEVSMARHQRGHREVIVRGQSPTILLDGAMHCRCFYEMSLADIVPQLLENVAANALETKIDPSYTQPFPYFVQYKESSFHCMHRAAALYGEWCFYNGTELVFGKLEKDKKVDLPMDRDLFDFGFSLKLVPLNFKAVAYNYLEKENYESASSGASVSDLEQYGEFSMGKSNDFFKQEATYESAQIIQGASDLESLVERKKNTLARELIVASGISDNPYINVGTIINITGEGQNEEDYGEYIVTHVSHSTDGTGNYQNHFEAIPADATFPPPNVNVRNVVPEFQTGIVTDNMDPENLGRIRVKLPWQGNDETPWMRIVNQYAGNERGFYFIPEIDDEVVVGFDRGNINHPYVIGSLYNGIDVPAVSQDQNNTMKSIRTRNGNEILFIDDDGKEEIKILNKDAANEISLSLEGNGKISIKTKGDLEVSAEGDMNFTAKKSITMKADQSINIESGSGTKIKASETKMEASSKFEIKATEVNIEGTASSKIKAAQTTIEGSGKVEVKGAMASVNGSGIMEVKGGLVKIN
jgi:type VI secretion system secreted protein VgrG